MNTVLSDSALTRSRHAATTARVDRIIIADHQKMVAEALANLLDNTPGLRVCARAEDFVETLSACRQHVWDVLLLEYSMPGTDTIDLVKRVLREHPGGKILVISRHDDEHLARRFLRAGAAGYITKDNSAADLLNGIQRIARGGRYVSATLADRLLAHLDGHTTGHDHANLSDREYTVLKMLAGGESVGTVASRLSLSSRTVSTYRRRVLQKLGLRNNAELTHYAIVFNLLS